MAETYRNAFLSRFSDRTGLKKTTFLQMYAPQIVRELLKNENLLMPKATWLLGIPGSGKTSILRLFSFDIVHDVIKHKSTYSEIYDVLKESKIILDDQIRYLGIYLPIDDIYSEAANVIIDDIDNDRIFYTIFDLRVAKQLILALKLFNGSDATIIVEIPSERMPPTIFSQDTNVDDLLIKIQQQEKLISQLLNSFPGTPIPKELELHSRISAFDLLNAQINYHNTNFIFMIDDAHELYRPQFAQLSKVFQRREISFPRWIATRKHILPLEMLLDSSAGTTDQRETETIDLDENIFKGQPALFRKFIKILIDKRLKLTDALVAYTSEDIQKFISSNLDIKKLDNSNELKDQKHDAIKISKRILYDLPELSNYINNNEIDIDPIDAELLLIKSHRAVLKNQQSLFNLEDEVSTKDRQAAEMFWKKRMNLPLYYGFEDILSAANGNVEQFMRVFSFFIDRLIYREELNKNLEISSQEQKKIFKKVTSHYINNIILRLQYGNKIYQLIDNLCRFFNMRTFEPNAPHAPGITQFAILASEIRQLRGDQNVELQKVLTIAVAYNVIIAEPPQHQGAKGSEKKHRFSVNRLLCIHYELPLQKGDFQRIPLPLLHLMCNQSLTPNEIKNKKGRQKQLWSYE